MQHGPALFQSSAVQQAGTVWQQAFSQCQHLERTIQEGTVGLVRVPRGPAVRVPAGTMSFVSAWCHGGLGCVPIAGVLEPASFVDGQLPSDLLIPLVLLTVDQGMVQVPVVNVGYQDRWLQPKAVLGELHIAQSYSSGSTVQIQRDEQQRVVTVQSIQGAAAPGIDFSQLMWPSLSAQEQEQVRAVLEKYRDTFNPTPVRQRYRRLAPSQYELVKAHIKELVDRKLNAKMRKDAFPLPRIEESLDALSCAKWFSMLDLASGYNQVPMPEQDREKTAFCTPFGLFEFNRMAFGLCNAPSTFQRLMERIFGDQSFHSLLLYLDDVVIFSQTFQQHLQCLDMVLGRLKQNLKLKLQKKFFQAEVSYLDHVISATGVSSDPEKICVVAERKRPSSVKELRSFLGFASYYRCFVKGFAHLAAPLHRLVSALEGSRKQPRPRLQGTLGQHWDEACEESFLGLKS
ncbi:hypothetical protein MHYP_G00149640 [Metynnis hypsauchen]